nr:MAG TPA: hypothetical protein [Caudoviricetes sp.]
MTFINLLGYEYAVVRNLPPFDKGQCCDLIGVTGDDVHAPFITLNLASDSEAFSCLLGTAIINRDNLPSPIYDSMNTKEKETKAIHSRLFS